MKYSLLITFIFLWAGCSIVGGSKSDKPEVTFRTDKSSYALGSTVTAVLQNKSNQPILYNLCSSKLEQKKDDDWTIVGPFITCKAIAKTLEPEGSEKYRIALDDSLTKKLSEGIYRIKTEVEINDKTTSLFTQAFDVSATIQQQ